MLLSQSKNALNLAHASSSSSSSCPHKLPAQVKKKTKRKSEASWCFLLRLWQENLKRRVRDILNKRRMIAFVLLDNPEESIMDIPVSLITLIPASCCR